MAVLSGKDGTIKISNTEIKPVSNWKLKLTSKNPDFVDNDTAGWTGRVGGAKDASGSFNMNVSTSYVAPLDEGDTATLILYADGASGTCYYTVPVIVDSVDVEVDRATGKVVNYDVTFSATGAVTKTGFFAASGV
jgi:hypothetical protein